MQKRLTKLVLCVLAVVCVNTIANDCYAHDAEDVARHCVRRVNHIVDRCTNAVADTTVDCVRRINELLEAGEVEAARRVARACIADIRDITDACSEAIVEICTRCVTVLINEFGAEELAARVRNHCVDSLVEISTLEDRAIGFIRQQFA